MEVIVHTRRLLLILWGLYVVVTLCAWINDRFDSIFAVCGCRWLESTAGGKSLTESA